MPYIYQKDLGDTSVLVFMFGGTDRLKIYYSIRKNRAPNLIKLIADFDIREIGGRNVENK